MNIVDQLT